MTSRVVAGLAACLAGGLLFFASTAGASPGLVKHCAGKPVATRTGIRLDGTHVRVTSTAYNADEVRLYAARPELRCGTALQVVNAYLAAKLDRPDGQCVGPALSGRGCGVGHWDCVSKRQTPARPGSFEQECTRTNFDRDGVVSRFTHVEFRETDHDHS